MSYQTNQEKVLAELRATLGNISADEVERLIEMVEAAENVFLSALAGCCCHCRQWQNGWRIWALKPTLSGKLRSLPLPSAICLSWVPEAVRACFPSALPEKRKAFMQALCILVQTPKAV